MNLYLVQHGKPVPEEENPERPLSEKGRADVNKVASFLEVAGIRPGRVFHSGKLRAKETAEIMASMLSIESGPQERGGLAPLDEVDSIADDILNSREDLMIVGHLPHLSKLVSLLAMGNSSLPVVAFQQGGILCLRGQKQEGAKGWKIAWMMVPEILPF
jgi:phosphohistidine phosphatase